MQINWLIQWHFFSVLLFGIYLKGSLQIGMLFSFNKLLVNKSDAKITQLTLHTTHVHMFMVVATVFVKENPSHHHVSTDL